MPTASTGWPHQTPIDVWTSSVTTLLDAKSRRCRENVPTLEKYVAPAYCVVCASYTCTTRLHQFQQCSAVGFDNNSKVNRLIIIQYLKQENHLLLLILSLFFFKIKLRSF